MTSQSGNDLELKQGRESFSPEDPTEAAKSEQTRLGSNLNAGERHMYITLQTTSLMETLGWLQWKGFPLSRMRLSHLSSLAATLKTLSNAAPGERRLLRGSLRAGLAVDGKIH